MRHLTDHIVNPANDRLTIAVRDEPGPGGANHRYEIGGFDVRGAPEGSGYVVLNFQNGPINEAGVNGITHEVLLAILCDRLRAFQRGPFACRENALALTKLEEAQHWLLHRTMKRMAAGVEGTHKADPVD
jgi:hypothetical protein